MLEFFDNKDGPDNYRLPKVNKRGHIIIMFCDLKHNFLMEKFQKIFKYLIIDSLNFHELSIDLIDQRKLSFT